MRADDESGRDMTLRRRAHRRLGLDGPGGAHRSTEGSHGGWRIGISALALVFGVMLVIAGCGEGRGSAVRATSTARATPVPAVVVSAVRSALATNAVSSSTPPTVTMYTTTRLHAVAANDDAGAIPASQDAPVYFVVIEGPEMTVTNVPVPPGASSAMKGTVETMTIDHTGQVLDSTLCTAAPADTSALGPGTPVPYR